MIWHLSCDWLDFSNIGPISDVYCSVFRPWLECWTIPLMNYFRITDKFTMVDAKRTYAYFLSPSSMSRKVQTSSGGLFKRSHYFANTDALMNQATKAGSNIFLCFIVLIGATFWFDQTNTITLQGR